MTAAISKSVIASSSRSASLLFMIFITSCSELTFLSLSQSCSKVRFVTVITPSSSMERSTLIVKYGLPSVFSIMYVVRTLHTWRGILRISARYSHIRVSLNGFKGRSTKPALFLSLESTEARRGFSSGDSKSRMVTTMLTLCEEIRSAISQISEREEESAYCRSSNMMQ